MNIAPALNGILGDTKRVAPLLRSRLFGELDPETAERVARVGIIRKFERNVRIINQGDSPVGIFIILEGRVKVFRCTEDGDEIITRLLGPSESLLENVVFYGRPSPVCAETESDAVLFAIPSSSLTHCIGSFPRFAMNMLGVLSERTNELMYQLELVTMHPAVERVAHFLLRVMLESGGPKVEITLPYEKAEVANHLGLTPETFSRCLKLLSARGIQVQGRQVRLEARDTLCFACDPLNSHKCRDRDKIQCRMFGL
ncbi:MAG: Crp/Fnr family transcriptional regulator [Hyphomicrobium zavarzinii]|uniref:Crp/Fnr family transcriptional regulator n=1 Tax=Hyphomicrobium zavarzinii TaxID=48292 RepID=UPI001A4129F5|nr:Crp/Fnr family transcriptional regulator [Hyphomicrobium zavarzinii]MBL8845960.1 Crp/Fnr family transcriptional regulator [Hyphomicrobium zavarzinii]